MGGGYIFSLSVRPPPPGGGTPIRGSFPGVWSHVLSRGAPPASGPMSFLSGRGYPSPGQGGSLGQGYPHLELGYPLTRTRLGCTPAGQVLGNPRGWCDVWWRGLEYTPPPPSGLVTMQAVCLLRRRTSLLNWDMGIILMLQLRHPNCWAWKDRWIL